MIFVRFNLGDRLVKNKRESTISDGILTKVIDVELKNTFIITDSVDYTNQEEVPDDYDEGCAPPDEPEFDYTIVNKKSKVKTRPVEESKPESAENSDGNTESVSSPPGVDIWSQVQQKCLEAAIKQFPKSTSDRWTCIARAVPDKNKVSCWCLSCIMCVCVCSRVCMCMCVCACMRVYVPVRAFVRACTYVPVRTCLRVHACVCVRVRKYMEPGKISVKRGIKRTKIPFRLAFLRLLSSIVIYNYILDRSWKVIVET